MNHKDNPIQSLVPVIGSMYGLKKIVEKNVEKVIVFEVVQL